MPGWQRPAVVEPDDKDEDEYDDGTDPSAVYVWVDDDGNEYDTEDVDTDLEGFLRRDGTLVDLRRRRVS